MALSEKDIRDAVDTIIAEAGGDGPNGMQAVAWVIANRARNRNLGIGEVVRQPGQFQGYEEGNSGTASLRNDDATRRLVAGYLMDAIDGFDVDPTHGADHFHADYVNPGWAANMERTAQIGGHTFYSSGAQPSGNAQAASLVPPVPAPPIDRTALQAIDSAAPRTTDNYIAYANQNATRNQPLNDDLTTLLNGIGRDLGVQFEVVSGGQPSTGSQRVGSHRHDDGGSGDVKMFVTGPDGSKQYIPMSSPAGQQLWAYTMQAATAAGAQGVGMAPDYMGEYTAHLGYGAPAAWGAGGRSANVLPWVQDAWQAGMQGLAPDPITAASLGFGVPPSPPVPAMPSAELSSQRAALSPPKISTGFGTQGSDFGDFMGPPIAAGPMGMSERQIPTVPAMPSWPSSTIGQAQPGIDLQRSEQAFMRGANAPGSMTPLQPPIPLPTINREMQAPTPATRTRQPQTQARALRQQGPLGGLFDKVGMVPTQNGAQPILGSGGLLESLFAPAQQPTYSTPAGTSPQNWFDPDSNTWKPGYLANR